MLSIVTQIKNIIPKIILYELKDYLIIKFKIFINSFKLKKNLMKISKQEEQIIAQFMNDSNNNLFGNIILIKSDFCLSEFLIV